VSLRMQCPHRRDASGRLVTTFRARVLVNTSEPAGVVGGVAVSRELQTLLTIDVNYL
jgi:hypothetical protein